MQAEMQAAPVSKAALWTGYIMSVVPALFLAMGGVMDLVKPPFVVEGLLRAGYPENVVFGLGVAVLVCVILFLIPRTCILGAIFLTGYLGGAVATHIRLGENVKAFGPIIFATVLWGGLYLRDTRLRALVPLRNSS